VHVRIPNRIWIANAELLIEQPPSPDEADGIGGECGIDTYEFYTFRERLRDQEPVEGIAMVERQPSKSGQMADIHGQQLDCISLNVIAYELNERLGQRELAKAHFHHDFPQAHETEQHPIAWVFDQRAGTGAKLGVAGNEPQNVCVSSRTVTSPSGYM
jgi:hypothetical protein